MTLWGDKTSVLPPGDQLEMDHKVYVVLVRKAKVYDYNGKRLKTAGETAVDVFVYDSLTAQWDTSRAKASIDSVNKEAQELLDWWLNVRMC